ncbi:PPC domain-containing DNA-binding protein [Brevibacillus sp. B_LB10_24]|uniref:PPC domain-containing DNA-binding protein n=1 Tax=Brevibacillus sp. B_LB10_24 TaxID=3380645 RepID=UPI0038BCC95F
MGNKRTNHSVYDRENGVIFGSLTAGTDLMEGIIAEYAKYDVASGMLTGIGSLGRATYVYGVDGPDGRPGYSDPVTVDGPIEILNATGFLCRNDEQAIDMHLHGLFVNKQGQVFGGHVLPGKNPVLITVEFTIKVGNSVEAVRSFHPELGFSVITFKQGG